MTASVRFVLLGLAAILVVLIPQSQARVVRPTPEFSWIDASGKLQSVRNLKGQPAVILIAPDPGNWTFRSQVGQLQRVYERLGTHGTLFFAAFTGTPDRVRSNIPFIQVGDGPRVGFLFEATEGFAIAIVGRDGNLDCLSNRVLTGQRVFDVIENSFAMQEALRRD